MAVVALTPILAAPRGTAVSWVALGNSADTHTLPGESNICVLIRSSPLANSAKPVPVPIASQDNYSVSYSTQTTIDASSDYVFGAFPRPEVFADEATGLISMAHGVTDANGKIAALRLPVARYGEAPPAATHATRIAVDPVAAHQRGAKLAWVAAHANNHCFSNSGSTYLLVDNASGASVNVPIVLSGKLFAPNTSDWALSAQNLPVPAASLYVFGPFRPDLYNSPDGYVLFSVTSLASVRFATFEA